MASTFTTTPSAFQEYLKAADVSRTMTTATELMTLPQGATITGMTLVGTAADPLTSASLSIGNSSSGTAYVNARDVKTAATGTGLMPLTLAADHKAALTADTKITATYAEVGTASTVGSWVLYVRYAFVKK